MSSNRQQVGIRNRQVFETKQRSLNLIPIAIGPYQKIFALIFDTCSWMSLPSYLGLHKNGQQQIFDIPPGMSQPKMFRKLPQPVIIYPLQVSEKSTDGEQH